MGMLFGFGNKNKESHSARKQAPQETIGQLRESMANAEKREVHVQHQIDKIVKQAKMKLAQGDKKGAVNAMKRKKLYDAELTKLENVKMTLETQAIQIESAAYNQETFHVMKSGNTTMSRLRKMLGIDAVDNLMDDIREEADLANEVNNAFTTPLDPTLEDDPELLAELDALDDTKQTTNSTNPKKNSSFTGFSLPSMPAFNKLSRKEDDDFKRLEAELAAA